MSDVLYAPEALGDFHHVADFGCGVPSLDQWLTDRSRPNGRRHLSSVFVIADSDGRVAAYYALATGAVARDFVPGPIRRNATDPIPALVIGRLAVDLRCQEQGLARVLVKDALTRCLRVREHAGFALVLVNPVDAVAERFWARWRFRPLPGDAHTMYLPTDGLAKVAVLAGRMTPAPPDRISPVG